MSDREPYPSEKQDRFIVRLPDGMRDRIKAAAEANNRSMNAEIVSILNDAIHQAQIPLAMDSVGRSAFLRGMAELMPPDVADALRQAADFINLLGAPIETLPPSDRSRAIALRTRIVEHQVKLAQEDRSIAKLLAGALRGRANIGADEPSKSASPAPDAD